MMSRIATARAAGLSALAAASVLAACGASDTDEATSDVAPSRERGSVEGASETSATVAETEADAAEAAQAAANLTAAETYLATNALADGVTVTDSGLQYRVLTAAEDGAPANPDGAVCVHYRGRLIDGTEFDSSYSRDQAAAFPLMGVIPGFAEGLALMSVGDSYEFTIPPTLGYGERGAGDVIPPNAALVFEVELLDVMDPLPGVLDGDCEENKRIANENLTAAEAFLADNATRDGVEMTESGLQYRVVTSGDPEQAPPIAGEFVCVHYRGTLLDGTEFDSSYARGAAAAFPSDRLIAGWVEALALMRPGAEWELFIHPDLGYGRAGAGGDIGPNAALVFTVTLIDVLPEGPPEQGVDCAA